MGTCPLVGTSYCASDFGCSVSFNTTSNIPVTLVAGITFLSPGDARNFTYDLVCSPTPPPTATPLPTPPPTPTPLPTPPPTPTNITVIPTPSPPTAPPTATPAPPSTPVYVQLTVYLIGDPDDFNAGAFKTALAAALNIPVSQIRDVSQPGCLADAKNYVWDFCVTFSIPSTSRIAAQNALDKLEQDEGEINGFTVADNAEESKKLSGGVVAVIVIFVLLAVVGIIVILLWKPAGIIKCGGRSKTYSF